jgi:serine/threonine protein kinase
MSLTVGSRLGPYEIIASIGVGGMGEVYKARDTRLDRTVAIKVLPEHIAKREDLRARFEREARAVARIESCWCRPIVMASSMCSIGRMARYCWERNSWSR